MPPHLPSNGHPIKDSDLNPLEIRWSTLQNAYACDGNKENLGGRRRTPSPTETERVKLQPVPGALKLWICFQHFAFFRALSIVRTYQNLSPRSWTPTLAPGRNIHECLLYNNLRTVDDNSLGVSRNLNHQLSVYFQCGRVATVTAPVLRQGPDSSWLSLPLIRGYVKWGTARVQRVTDAHNWVEIVFKSFPLGGSMWAAGNSVWFHMSAWAWCFKAALTRQTRLCLL